MLKMLRFNLFAKKSFCTANSINTEAILTKTLGKDKNILGLYLNTPKNRNALSKSLLDSLKRNIEYVNTNENIRVVLLLSNQPGYFCAGADLKERQSMNEIETENFVHNLRKTFLQFEEMRVPSIVGIDGFALGGGLELALSSDIRICTKKSTLGLTEVSLGIIPGAGGTQRLPRLLGVARAKELIYTAERIPADKALNIGLVNHVVEKYEDLETKTVEIAEKIVKNAPLSIVNAKKAINHGIGYDIKTGLDIEGLCYAQIVKTEDRVEGLKAFLEKRSPNYKGK
jgi:methylglutaconyl-CoA hydratase